MSLDAQRLKNAWARLRAGLPPRGAVISPEVPNDLFQAHRSFYAFAASFAAGLDVLDLGCGTGYGTADLAAAGARRAVGIDADERSIRYARRHFRTPKLAFHRAEAERLPGPLSASLGTFDRIVMGNVLSHLADPEAALTAAEELLTSTEGEDSLLIASVPPILDGQTRERHRALGTRSPLFLWDWQEMLAGRYASVRLFRALPPEGSDPDFSDPRPSRLSPGAFLYEEIPLAHLDDAGGLSAVFVASKRSPADAARRPE